MQSSSAWPLAPRASEELAGVSPDRPDRWLWKGVTSYRALGDGARRDRLAKRFDQGPATSLARAAGFVPLGVVSENLCFVVRIPGLEMRSPDHRARCFVSNRGERYMLATIFDDGTEILTWSHARPMTPSSGGVSSNGGTGWFDDDWKAHGEQVEARMAQGATPLAVADLADTRAMTEFYYARLVSGRLTFAWAWPILMGLWILWTA